MFWYKANTESQIIELGQHNTTNTETRGQSNCAWYHSGEHREVEMEEPGSLVISVVSVVTRDQPDLQSREVVIIIEYIFRTLYFDKVWHVFIFLPVSQPVSNAADFQIVLIFIPQMSSRQQLEHTANPHHSWDLSS